MESAPVTERWEVDLWTEIEEQLMRHGGSLGANGSESGTLGGVLTSNGYSAKVKKKWGTFLQFLESCDPARFTLSEGKKRILSLNKTEAKKEASKQVKAAAPASVSVPARQDGVVVEFDGRKMFIRSASQSLDCAKQDLYFGTTIHLRDHSQKGLLRLGATVNFAKSPLRPNPNPYCSDIVVVDKNNGSNANDNNAPLIPSPSSLVAAAAAASSVAFMPVKIIRERSACVAAALILLGEDMLTLDCEGINLGRSVEDSGGLCLVQIGTKSSGVFIFDPVEMPGGFQAMLNAGLGRVLDGPCIKFVHDCRMDVRALFLASGVVGQKITNVLDTQIMYGLLNPDDLEIGLISLLRAHGSGNKKHPGKLFATHNWRARPLLQDAIEYASADVELLFPAAEEMVKLLDRQNKLKDARNRSAARVLREIQAAQEELKAEPANVILAKVFGDDDDEHQGPQQQFFYAPRIEYEFEALLAVLPVDIRALVEALPDVEANLIDVKLDEGHVAGFTLKNHVRSESDLVVNRDHLEYILEKVGPRTGSNRATVGQSLHRCSFIVDRCRKEWFATGATIRMARAVQGIADTIRDILKDGKSILLVGHPGSGKTTLLRDIARVLGEIREVMVVDTTNEIAGEHTVRHHAIGRARRMKVGDRSDQYRVMLEAVQNHTPEALVIDEIGTHEEVQEAVAIKLRGVQLIATTHGQTLADVINNPQLKNLLGGVNVVTLSADERAQEGAPTKTRLEQRTRPAFDVCIELHSMREWRIHYDINAAVNCVLRNMGETVLSEVRIFDETTSEYTKSQTAFP